MNVSDELQKLSEMYRSGVLSDAEFAAAKSKLLDPQPAAPFAPAGPFGQFGFDAATREQQTRHWAMILHLSIFAGYVVPLAGLVAPIVIWQMKKDELPGLDSHGRNLVNWIITHIIYFVICLVLMFVFIGIPMLIVLAALAIIFPIVAAIKASNGEVWKYPTAIRFLK